jgi:hypothetical protein
VRTAHLKPYLNTVHGLGCFDYRRYGTLVRLSQIHGNITGIANGARCAPGYRPKSQAAVERRAPRELPDELAAIEAEIAEGAEALWAALADGQTECNPK